MMSWVYLGNEHLEERILWFLVLRRAIFDYVLYRGVGAHMLDWKRASRYIFGGVKHEDGLSFDEVCEMLQWDPDYIRRLIKRLTREDVRKMEASKFKDEFMSVSMEKLVQNNLRWSLGWAVPYYPSINISRQYGIVHSLFALHKIVWKRLTNPPPVVVWNLA
jgi:hypothetical protein